MAVTAVVGCGKQNETDESENKKIEEDNKVEEEVHPEVTGRITVGINSYRNSDFEAVCEAFEKMYPNVEVVPNLFESKSDDATEYLTAQKMAEKELPDIIYDDAGNIPAYIQNGWMYPLTELIKDDAEYNNVPDNLKECFKYNENIYALPQTVHSNVMIINNDLVEEMNLDLPDYNWNWDDYKEFIQNCTNSTYSGIEDMQGQYNWMPGAMTEGRSIVGYDYENGTFDLEAVRKYINYYFDIVKLRGVEAISLRQNSESGQSDYVKKFGVSPGTDAAFIAGKVAGTFTGTWAYANWSRNELEFNWDFYPVPQVVEGRVPIHVDYCWMTTDVKEENLEAAWAFLRYVTYSTAGNLARLTMYDEDHITDSMSNVYYIPCTQNEEVIEKFRSLPYVTDAVLYIYDNLDKGYQGDPEKYVPGFESVEYAIIGKLAYESVTGRDDFSSKMMDAQTKANAEIANYRKIFDDALAKFEQEFFASH